MQDIPSWWLELCSKSKYTQGAIHLPKRARAFERSSYEILRAMSAHANHEALIAEDNHQGVVHHHWKNCEGPEPEQLKSICQQYQVIAQNIHNTWPIARTLRDALQTLSHYVHCNLYANAPGVRGLHPHSDASPVVVVQLSGRKQWTFSNQETLRMEPGDVLWIPEGLGHFAEPIASRSDLLDDQISFHLTFGIRNSDPTTWSSQTDIATPKSDADLWPITNGFFVQPQWPEPKAGSQRYRIEKILEEYTNHHPQLELYLRGSILEQPKPHPQADIDIVLLCPRSTYSQHQTHLRDILKATGRLLDLRFFDPAEGFSSWESMLLGCRSHPISHTKRRFDMIPSTLDVHRELWHNAQLSSLPDRLPPPGIPRVHMVKRLLRSIGILWLCQNQEFSRDLVRCLAWSKEILPGYHQDFVALYQSLDTGRTVYIQGDHATNYPIGIWIDALQEKARAQGIDTR